MARERLIARAGCWYDGRVVPPGELFFARPDDAPVLILLHKAERADDLAPVAEAVGARRRYRRKDLQAES